MTGLLLFIGTACMVVSVFRLTVDGITVLGVVAWALLAIISVRLHARKEDS